MTLVVPGVALGWEWEGLAGERLHACVGSFPFPSEAPPASPPVWCVSFPRAFLRWHAPVGLMLRKTLQQAGGA